MITTLQHSPLVAIGAGTEENGGLIEHVRES